MKALLNPTPRDYPEDALSDDDNGRYMHTCPTCKKTFVGHKRRVGQCKVCAGVDEAEAKRRAEWLNAHGAPKEWLIMTEEEIAGIKADLVRLVWDNSEMKHLLARVRPHLPSHGTHAEDLINSVEAAIGP